MEFQKVAWSEEKARGDDDDKDYGVNNVIKFQTELLPVKGTVPEVLESLRSKFELYAARIYDV